MSSSSSNQASWLACSHLGTQASRYLGIQVSGHPGFRASRLLGSSTNTTKPNQRQQKQEKAAAAAARPPGPPGSRGRGQRPGSPKPLPGRGGHPWLSHVISPSVAQLSEWSRKRRVNRASCATNHEEQLIPSIPLQCIGVASYPLSGTT